MNPFAEFETDHRKEQDGIRFVVSSTRGAGEMAFILRRAGGTNRKFRYRLAELGMKHRADLLDETPAGKLRALDVQEEITLEAFLDTVLLGWENVDGRDGQPLPFSKASARDLLESCPGLWDALREAAVDVERFRPNGAGQDGADLGKS